MPYKLPTYAFMVFCLCAFVLMPDRIIAQQPQMQPDRTIDAATRTAVIDNLLKKLDDSYVFPETAKRMEADIRNRVKAKEYDELASAQKFAEKLTADLRSISKDKHLGVKYSHQPFPVRPETTKPTDAEKAEGARHAKFMNAAFEQVERMKGNIGYIRFNAFVEPENGADTVAAAMNFIANTDSLIFDLRNNGGGHAEMVALISSYLFGDTPVHLNDLYWRKGNRTAEFWTKPTVLGTKYGNKDVYILTSNYTFSGAEEFSYNLKNLKRATIIGETTGGGAHPGGFERLGDHFVAFIPTGRAINPITKTNWEGTGVEPDIKVPKEQALKTAYLMALTKSVETIKDENVKGAVKQLIEQTKKELDEMKVKK